MKRKRKHTKVEEPAYEPEVCNESISKPEVSEVEEKNLETTQPTKPFVEHGHKKIRPVFTRVSVDPSRHYRTHESRESWGPNVKGKKFRKEKGKKKRCPNAGVRIDGAVKSIRLDG